MILNWPNRLTVARMALGPVATALLLNERPGFRAAALATFAVAALTDVLDGYLARRYGWITNLGRFLDPLADKLLVSLALIGLVQVGLVPVWAAWVIIGRELLVTGLRTIAAYAGVIIMPSRMGKLKTVFEMSAVFLYLALSVPWPRPGVLPDGLHEAAASSVLAAATALAVFSGLDYIWRNRSILKRLLW